MQAISQLIKTPRRHSMIWIFRILANEVREIYASSWKRGEIVDALIGEET
jgi:hypothetical protein